MNQNNQAQETQKGQVGKTPGLGDPKYHLPPSETWSSDENCKKVYSILSTQRFISYNKTNKDESKKEKKFNKLNEKNQEALKILASQTEMYIQMTLDETKILSCGFFFRDIPLKKGDDLDKNTLSELENLCKEDHKNQWKYSTIYLLRKLLEPKFREELILYFKKINNEKNQETIGDIINEIFWNEKNANLQTADTFVQYAFAKYLNDQNENNESIEQKYQEFYQNQKQFIFDETYRLLNAFKQNQTKKQTEENQNIQTNSSQNENQFDEQNQNKVETKPTVKEGDYSSEKQQQEDLMKSECQNVFVGQDHQDSIFIPSDNLDLNPIDYSQDTPSPLQHQHQKNNQN